MRFGEGTMQRIGAEGHAMAGQRPSRAKPADDPDPLRAGTSGIVRSQ